MTDYEEFIEFMHELADASDALTLESFRSSPRVENKETSGFDPVTEADRSSEKAIRNLIESRFPDHGIIGEEFGSVNVNSEFVWVLDPIDGTRAYISGIPVWGTLIGLTRNGNAVAGMMSQPFTHERFFGDKSGSFHLSEGKTVPMQTRGCESLSAAVLFSTTPNMFNSDEISAYKEIEESVRMHRYGTDCYGYAMLAAGLADLVIECGLQPYDIVALIPIIEGAGGIVSNWQGEPANQGGQIVACGDKSLHESIVRKLSCVHATVAPTLSSLT